MWGPNYYWLPRSSGLEIKSARYVCTHWDGKIEKSISHRSCLLDRGVDGFELDVLVHAEARPGPQTLLFNGLEIPFELELPADPGTATLVVDSCSVLRERDPRRSPPLLFTRYKPAQ